MWDRALSPWRAPSWQKMLFECLAMSSFVDISMENWAGEGGCIMFSGQLSAENRVIVMRSERDKIINLWVSLMSNIIEFLQIRSHRFYVWLYICSLLSKRGALILCVAQLSTLP